MEMHINQSCDWSTWFMRVIMLELPLVSSTLQVQKYRFIVTYNCSEHSVCTTNVHSVCTTNVHRQHQVVWQCTVVYKLCTVYLYINLYVLSLMSEFVCVSRSDELCTQKYIVSVQVVYSSTVSLHMNLCIYKLCGVVLIWTICWGKKRAVRHFGVQKKILIVLHALQVNVSNMCKTIDF
jgi:hypothetical protein